ncbi:copia protein [Lasius niger]|uniref:Copia protein n=1 Tax=Lasius niger TaxID=67767 RepID=A0A0J7MV58_LASNI|nr:copia protein [Lasius niger]
MAEQDRFKVPLFDGTNFDNWKFRMETLLEEHELLEYVKEAYTSMITIEEVDSPEVRIRKEEQLKQLKRNDRKCKSQIVQRIADSHLEYVKDEETAHGIWSVLSSTFERKGIANQLRLRETLLTIKYSTSEAMGNHFLKFDKAKPTLKVMQATPFVREKKTSTENPIDSVNGGVNSITVKEVLSVPELQCNLLSIRKLDLNKFTVSFEDGKGVICKGNTVIVIAYRKDKLYKLDFRDNMECANVCTVSNDVELWHKSDLCGPMDTTSYNGKQYVLTFIDDYRRPNRDLT